MPVPPTKGRALPGKYASTCQGTPTSDLRHLRPHLRTRFISLHPSSSSTSPYNMISTSAPPATTSVPLTSSLVMYIVSLSSHSLLSLSSSPYLRRTPAHWTSSYSLYSFTNGLSIFISSLFPIFPLFIYFRYLLHCPNLYLNLSSS